MNAFFSLQGSRNFSQHLCSGCPFCLALLDSRVLSRACPACFGLWVCLSMHTRSPSLHSLFSLMHSLCVWPWRLYLVCALGECVGTWTSLFRLFLSLFSLPPTPPLHTCTSACLSPPDRPTPLSFDCFCNFIIDVPLPTPLRLLPSSP